MKLLFVLLGLIFSTTPEISPNSPPIEMPIIRIEEYKDVVNAPPIPERGEQYRKWLAASVKIMVPGASGSGTIVYYDGNEWAYIQSCGHLWKGSMTAEQAKGRNLKCKIMVWYHNSKKLEQPRTYDVDVLYYFNARGIDSSLLRFKPDWEPDYFPIAPEDYKMQEGAMYHSCGCDAGSEVANYNVQFIRFESPDFVTVQNSPRPGRSGGGLMGDDYYLGICWGTSDTSGQGVGFFTPFPTVRRMNKEQGYGWLNEVSFLAQQIPVVDRNSSQGKYPKKYIPIPKKD